MSKISGINENMQAELLEKAINMSLYLADSTNWQNFQQGWEEIPGSSPAATSAQAKAADFLASVKLARKASTKIERPANALPTGWAA